MPHSKIPIYMYILNEKIIFEKKELQPVAREVTDG